jgi:hypothetical protein
VFCDEGNSVDDDLHKQLDFEDPKEQDEEQDRNTECLFVSRDSL